MNCPFCQQPCHLTSAKESIGSKDCKCYHHSREVSIIFNAIYENIYIVSFTCEYKGHSYNLKYYNFSTFSSWSLSEVDPIIELPYLPWNITPDNIDQKIQMLLLFS